MSDGREPHLRPSTTSFTIRDVSTWTVHSEEAQGTDEKCWLVDAETDQKWLFKPNTIHTRSDGAEWSQHEDLSEKLVSELGRAMELPCARIEFAKRNGRTGCISLDLKPAEWELQSGSVLLSGLFPDYVSGAEQSNKERKHHSLPNIQYALNGTAAPPGAHTPAGFAAFDVFVGYLLLDALVANRDRHDENWAIMRSRDGASQALAGSYDHARALGSTLREARIADHLRRTTVEEWARRGTAWRFEHRVGQPIQTLVELAVAATTDMVTPPVRTYWRDRVEAVTPQVMEDTMARVPEMSDVLATFIQQVVAINRRRVLDER